MRTLLPLAVPFILIGIASCTSGDTTPSSEPSSASSDNSEWWSQSSAASSLEPMSSEASGSEPTPSESSEITASSEPPSEPIDDVCHVGEDNSGEHTNYTCEQINAQAACPSCIG